MWQHREPRSSSHQSSSVRRTGCEGKRTTAVRTLPCAHTNLWRPQTVAMRESRMTRNGHVRFGERSRETRPSRDEKVRSAPTLSSPLLANIALHGMEQIISTYSKGQEKTLLVRYADDVRHLTHNEILLAEKGGTEEYGLRVISPTWNRKAKGKGACEKRGKRVKALMRCPATPA